MTQAREDEKIVMKASSDGQNVIVEGVKDFHLDHTFDNGQCFRWEKESDGSYTGVAFGKAINISERGGEPLAGKERKTILLENTSLEEYEGIWKSYLDLERDYGTIKADFAQKDATMARAIEYGAGLRILQQDPWETLISFIISQNNNIPRIKKCIEGLCQHFGEEIGFYRGKPYYAFPSPEAMALRSAADLEPIKLGYRAKYILETARLVAEDGGARLQSLKEVPLAEAQDYLLSLCGVGPKVANCIMLFSMGKYECFPIDVWVRRVMNQLYFINEKDMGAMAEFAARNFGSYGGIAQQYLFYYMREISKKGLL